jgi:hypothetical protein
MTTRLNPERYAVHGEWRHAAGWAGFVVLPDGNDDRADITVQVADLLEKRSNHVWRSGAYKVTLRNVPGMRSKTFYGETAWSDAARYASDAATKCGDWRWHPDL